MAHPHKKKMIFAVSMAVILTASFALHSVASTTNNVSAKIMVLTSGGWEEQSASMSGLHRLDAIISSGGVVTWAFGDSVRGPEMAINTNGNSTDWKYVPYPENALPSGEFLENFTPAYPETGASMSGWTVVNTNGVMGVSYFDGLVFEPASTAFPGSGNISIYASQGSAWGLQPGETSMTVGVFDTVLKSWNLSGQSIPVPVYSAAADGGNKILYALGADANLYAVNLQGDVRKLAAFPVAANPDTSLVLAQGNTIFVMMVDDGAANAFYSVNAGRTWVSVMPLMVSHLMGPMSSIEMMNGLVSLPNTGNGSWAYLSLNQDQDVWQLAAYPLGLSSQLDHLLYSDFSSDGHQQCIASSTVIEGSSSVACYDFSLGHWADVAAFSLTATIPAVTQLSKVVALGNNQVAAFGQGSDNSLLLYYNGSSWSAPGQSVSTNAIFSTNATYYVNPGNIWASWVP